MAETHAMEHHLLLIVPWLELGGADKFNLDLLTQLVERGWRVSIATTRRASHQWREEFAKITNHIVDIAGFPPTEQPARLMQLARTGACTHILVSHSTFGYAVLPYLRSHLPDTAILDYNHMEGDWGDGGFPALSVQLRDNLDLQVVSSQHLRQWMILRGAKPTDTFVATTNINLSRWNRAIFNCAEIRATLQIDRNVPVVLYAARLARQKQPLLALRVMRDVVRARPSAVFLVAGDGQFAPYVRGFIRAHRLEQNIRFLGPQPTEQIRQLLAISDILFLPSEMEGISLAIYEAMAMGVIPVSAGVGGQAELVTPETGILVRRSANEHAAYLQSLLELIDDNDRRRAMRTEARKRVEAHFQLDQMGDRMIELLQLAQERRINATQPSAADALASARRAILQAESDAAEQTNLDRPLRRSARTLFWQAVEHGAWWLVPLLERVRWDV